MISSVRPLSVRKQFRVSDSGSIAIMSALFMSLLLAGAGLAVDAGSLHLEKRTAQSAVDLAAIIAAANLDKPETAARGSIAANHISEVVDIVVTTGRYTADPAVVPSARFQANATPFNAVEVKLKKKGKQYFSQLFSSNPMFINVVGVAASSAEATFSLGSRLLGVHDGLPNKLLGGLLGGNVSLSINDYNALASADIKMFDFLNALATETHVTAGSYTDVLNSSADVGDVLSAIATVAGHNGDAQAAAAATLLKSHSNAGSLAIPLNKLVNLGTAGAVTLGQSSPGLNAAIAALDMINGAANVANGNKQVSIDLAGTVPGLLSLKLDVAIGEPAQQSPWVKVGQTGATLNSAASRIRLVAQVGGTGLLAGLSLKLPILINLAPSQARLSNIGCGGGDITNSSVTVATTAGLAETWIGEVGNPAFGDLSLTPVVADAAIANKTLLGLSVLKITGKSHIAIGSTYETPLTFDYADIQQLKIKSTSSTDLGGSLVQSLLGGLQLTVSAVGLNLLTVKTDLLSSLSAVAPPIDDVLHTILTSLGVHLGEADVVVHGVRCDGAVLVN